MSFAPCPSCGRHVRTTEAACPFCEHGTGGVLAPTPGLSARVTRAAIYAFTTTLAVAGCTSGSPTSSSSGSSASSGSTSSSGDGSSGVAPAYGAPAPDDSGATSATSTSSASAYGGPPSSSTSSSSGDPAPAYGAPAIDAGK